MEDATEPKTPAPAGAEEPHDPRPDDPWTPKLSEQEIADSDALHVETAEVLELIESLFTEPSKGSPMDQASDEA